MNVYIYLFIPSLPTFLSKCFLYRGVLPKKLFLDGNSIVFFKDWGVPHLLNLLNPDLWSVINDKTHSKFETSSVLILPTLFEFQIFCANRFFYFIWNFHMSNLLIIKIKFKFIFDLISHSGTDILNGFIYREIKKSS